jgi:glycosyltransferase involved in cell wall biosynthesis
MMLSQQPPEKILFITRKYPPSIGGMETAAYELYNALYSNTAQVDLIAWGGSKKWLPVVYFWLFGRAMVNVLARRPEVILLQDGVMAPLGWALKFLSGLPTLIIIHGLEVTHKNTLYRSLVLPFIKRQTAFVAVSEGTRRAVIAATGLEDSRIAVIHNGLSDAFYSSKPRCEQLLTVGQTAGIPFSRLERSRVLVTTGRLIKRKGVSWFIDNVMPKIVADDSSVLYLVAGSGPQRTEIELAIKRNNLADNVRLLGQVSDECLTALYNAADIFVMPNIHVPNDIEGFGIVAIEAASCGATVVASDLDGIADAVIDGMNGYLVPAGDASAYICVITRELTNRSQSPSAIRRYTLQHYSWAECARAYLSLAQSVVASSDARLESSPEDIPRRTGPQISS